MSAWTINIHQVAMALMFLLKEAKRKAYKGGRKRETNVSNSKVPYYYSQYSDLIEEGA